MKKTKKRTKGLAHAPSRADNSTAAEKARRKQFLRNISKADRMVVFTGGGSVSHYGFKSDGDLILFLQDQVYAHKGGDCPVFMNILKSIAEAQQKASEEQADPDLDDVLDELDEDEEDEEEAPAKKEDEKIVPMKPKKKKTTNVPEKDEAAVLRARLAELEGEDDDEDDDEDDS